MAYFRRILESGHVWIGVALLLASALVIWAGAWFIDWLWTFPEEFAKGTDMDGGPLAFVVGIFLAFVMGVVAVNVMVVAGLHGIVGLVLITMVVLESFGVRKSRAAPDQDPRKAA